LGIITQLSARTSSY